MNALRIGGLLFAVALGVVSTRIDSGAWLLLVALAIGAVTFFLGRVKKERDLLGFFVSPLIPVAALTVWRPFSPLACLLVGLPLSYFLMLFLGLPLSASLVRTNRKAWRAFGAWGLFIGTFVGFLMAHSSFEVPTRLHVVATCLFFGFAGFLTAFCYWFLAIRKEESKENF